VALNASGGSTNHALHLVAMARACGLIIDWHDIAAISAVTPLLARIYPNGAADVNHFQAAGGTQFVLRELIAAGLMYGDVNPVAGSGLSLYTREPYLDDGVLAWRDAVAESLDRSVLRPVADAFAADGGLKLVQGNLGRAVVKVSAVPADRRAIIAPVRIYNDQAELHADFNSGKLDGADVVAVVRFQGPRANGMPELHKLTPPLSVLQDRGQRVALLTDGRMSGASGTVLAAIHVTPEAVTGGPLAKLRDGDIVRLDPDAGVLEAQVSAETWAQRESATPPTGRVQGAGRELFSFFRNHAADAESGGGPLFSE